MILGMKQRNVLAAAILLSVALGHGYLTAQIPPTTLPDTPDSAFLPWINTVLLSALALMLLAQGLLSQTSVDGEKNTGAAVKTAQPVIFLGVFVAYIAALQAIGFVVASILFFASAMFLFGERRPGWLFLGSVGIPSLLFVLFRHGFSIVLPRGILPVFFG